jgi:hypothetical protein
MNIRLLAETGDEPVTVDEAKTQLRYYDNDQDQYIGALISAARTMAEIYNGRQQTLKQFDLALDAWPGSAMVGINAMPNPYFNGWPSDAYRLLAGVLPAYNGVRLAAPLVSVSSVTYKDTYGTVHTLTQDVDFIVDTWKEPGLICPLPYNNWPITGLWPSSAIHVQFTSGRVPNPDAAKAYEADHPGATPTVVPTNIKQGILLLVTQWFIQRIPFDAIRFVAEVPFSVTALFTSDKLWV